MTRPIVSANEVLRFRASRGWTQAQAAKWWGVSVRSWRRWETGASPIPTPLAARILPALKRLDRAPSKAGAVITFDRVVRVAGRR